MNKVHVWNFQNAAILIIIDAVLYQSKDCTIPQQIHLGFGFRVNDIEINTPKKLLHVGRHVDTR